MRYRSLTYCRFCALIGSQFRFPSFLCKSSESGLCVFRCFLIEKNDYRHECFIGLKLKYIACNIIVSLVYLDILSVAIFVR